MKKRVLSIVLTLVLCFGLLPITTMAVESSTASPQSTDDTCHEITRELDVPNEQHLGTTSSSTSSSYSSNTDAGGYTITVSEAENGTVISNISRAPADTTVTLTVSPDIGYGLDELNVLDSNKEKAELTDIGNGEYTFKLPENDVTVSATFKISPSFTDVSPDDYFFVPLWWAYNNGITDGIGGNMFGPNVPCTRAQIITFLWRASGQPTAERTDMPFSDVESGSYYYSAVLWAAENGISNGMNSTEFGPELICSREHAVTFLYRYAKLSGMDTSAGESADIIGYSDISEIADYALPSFRWTVNEGIIKGYNSKLMPRLACTRAHIITMLYRTLSPQEAQ